MSSCHCEDQSISIDGHNVPRTGKALRFRRFISFFIESLFTRSNDGEHIFACNINFANCVVLRIAYVDEMLILSENVAHSLWMMELSFRVLAIYQSNLSVSDLILELHRIFVDEDDAIIGCVRDDDQITIESSLLLNADHFAGVSEILTAACSFLRALTYRVVHLLCLHLAGLLLLWLPSNCGAVLQSLIVKVISYGEEQVEHLTMTFSGKDQDWNITRR